MYMCVLYVDHHMLFKVNKTPADCSPAIGGPGKQPQALGAML